MKILNQYPFEFYGSIFTVYKTDQRKLLVPVQHMCEILGLNSGAQLKRIRDHKVLSEGLRTIRAPIILKDGRAREKDLACILLEYLPYWLAWVDVTKMNNRVRGKIVRFQRAVIDMLWFAYSSDILPDNLVANVDMKSSTN